MAQYPSQIPPYMKVGAAANDASRRLQNLGTMQANGQYLNPTGGGYMNPEQYKTAVNNMNNQQMPTQPIDYNALAAQGLSPSQIESIKKNMYNRQMGNSPGWTTQPTGNQATDRYGNGMYNIPRGGAGSNYKPVSTNPFYNSATGTMTNPYQLPTSTTPYNTGPSTMNTNASPGVSLTTSNQNNFAPNPNVTPTRLPYAGRQNYKPGKGIGYGGPTRYVGGYQPNAPSGPGRSSLSNPYQIQQRQFKNTVW